MKSKKKFKLTRAKIIKMVIAVVAVVALIIGVNIAFTTIKRANSKPEIVSKSTLEKIINVNDLSTFEAVYNGIAKVENKEKTDKIDYYVSYEAKVKAGIDVTQVSIDIDEENKKILITMPEVKITETNVDITSLDYIIENKKIDTSKISQEAYSKCISDVENEIKTESAIYTLAKDNAKNIITALIEPLTNQVDNKYILEIV